MKQTNYDLQRYYRAANRLYFGNRLPKDMPMRFANIRELGKTWVCKHNAVLGIEISSRLRCISAVTVMVVLHEMLHVEKTRYKGHGWRFDKRMLRLAKMGAFNGLW